MAFEILTLTDAASGATARILPDLGFNCFSFQVTDRGEPVELLWADAEFAGGQARPTRSGIPILFPFAGRLRGTSFDFQRQHYTLPAADDRGNSIHGFVLNRAWRVIECAADQAIGQFQASVDAPEILSYWPADFRITVHYDVRGGLLRGTAAVENPDQKPLPFGLGFHGYFRLPLRGSGTSGSGTSGSPAGAADCRLRVPVSRRWELEHLLPTGECRPAAQGPELTAGFVIGQTQFDDVFDGLDFIGGVCTTRVTDPHNGRTMTMTFDDHFPLSVVFNPPHREAVCIEPYSTAPDAFTLLARGIDPHLLVLAPGERWQAGFSVRLDPAAE